MMIDEILYNRILRVMPIPAVDLIVEDENRRILLARRANEPAKGMWWFPGGRVHFLETRVQAAKRKLQEECALMPVQMSELGTYDVIVERSDDPAVKVHGISTLYRVRVNSKDGFVLDAQNSEADWQLPQEWLQLDLHPFVKEQLLNLGK
jgi:colanic acid biosynthesis protein WcaH